MIQRIYVDNFKSLVDFELQLSKFTCLIGLNGAGKSTLLQALDFSSALMLGEVEDWLDERGWIAADLNSKLVSRSNIKLEIDVEFGGEIYTWKSTFNRTKLCCTFECITRKSDNADIFYVKDGNFGCGNFKKNGGRSHDESKRSPISFKYQGSSLSQIKESELPSEVVDIKKVISSLRSLDLLSPELLRKKARHSDRNDIGIGGKQLSAFIHRMDSESKEELLSQIQEYYPQVSSIHTKTLRAGWRQIEIKESFDEQKQGKMLLNSEARHVNDGMLRLLAILAQQYSPLGTLLFDEIENGINPELTEKLVDALVNSKKQIIVTTHSPMVLNYLEDDVAKKSVILLYRRKDGCTRAHRFFDLPLPAKKLRTLAPGDAMLDIYLDEVVGEGEQFSETDQAC